VWKSLSLGAGITTGGVLAGWCGAGLFDEIGHGVTRDHHPFVSGWHDALALPEFEHGKHPRFLHHNVAAAGLVRI
jgi:hypothetical protein